MTTAEQGFAASWAAIGKLQAGAPVDEVCPFCGGTLVVEGLPPGGPWTQWLVDCPCGRSRGTIKGL